MATKKSSAEYTRVVDTRKDSLSGMEFEYRGTAKKTAKKAPAKKKKIKK
jgi:hypothetical protein